MVVVTGVYQQRVFEAQNSEKKKKQDWHWTGFMTEADNSNPISMISTECARDHDFIK
jgi:hypothetical protein